MVYFDLNNEIPIILGWPQNLTLTSFSLQNYFFTLNSDTISDAAKFVLYTELEDIQNLRMARILHNEFTAMWEHVPNANMYEVTLMDQTGKKLATHS